MPLPVNNYDKDELKCLYNHDLVITLDELPDIKAQAAGNDALASPDAPTTVTNSHSMSYIGAQ